MKVKDLMGIISGINSINRIVIASNDLLTVYAIETITSLDDDLVFHKGSTLTLPEDSLRYVPIVLWGMPAQEAITDDIDRTSSTITTAQMYTLLTSQNMAGNVYIYDIANDTFNTIVSITEDMYGRIVIVINVPDESVSTQVEETELWTIS